MDVTPVGENVGTTLVVPTGIVPLVGAGKVRMGEGMVSKVVGCGIEEIGAEGISPVCAGAEIPPGMVVVGAGDDGSSGIVLEDRGADGIRPVGKKRSSISDGTMLDV